jgi:hypothetical protein
MRERLCAMQELGPREAIGKSTKEWHFTLRERLR